MTRSSRDTQNEIDEGRRDTLKTAAGIGLVAVMGGLCTGKAWAAPQSGLAGLAPWLPAPGTIVDVGLNTLASQALDVPKYATRSVYDAWCGITYFPWWGRFGSFVQTGGGHTNSAYNDIYAYFVEERRHIRIKTHAPIFQHTDRYVADEVTGWMWADTSTNALQVGEAFSAHTYAYGVAIPPGIIPGDAPNGWLFTPGKTGIPFPASKGSKQSHRIAVGIAEKWEAHGAPLPRGTGHAGALYDSKRKKIIALPNAVARSLVWIDAITEKSGTLNLDKEISGYYQTAFYDVESDLYLCIRFNPASEADKRVAAIEFQIIDPEKNTVSFPSITGELPRTANTGGWDWVPEWRALVFYPGRGNEVWTLSATGKDLKGPYKLEKQNLSGVATSTFTDTPHYNRFRYIPALQCFLWFPTVEHPVQAFGVRPPTKTPPSIRTIATITVGSDILDSDVPFTVGQVFKKGDVFDSVRIEGIASQCNVLNRWEDGSIKFAALTGIATFKRPREFQLKQAPAPAQLKPAKIPPLSLRIEAAGSTIDLKNAERLEVRFAGSEMTEYSASQKINAHILVLFCIRVYRSGDVWVRWTVHNGYLRVPGARNFEYRLRVFVADKVIADQQVDHKSHARITGSGWRGRACNVQVKHDLNYLASTKLVPNYGWRKPTDAAFKDIAQSSIPMGHANLRTAFPNTGYDDQIGLLPRWDALYLTSGDVRAYRGVIANAESGGAYSVHFLDEATLRLPKFSDYPDLSFDDPVMTYSGGRAFSHDGAHQPSIGYLAYLLTADAFFLEEIQHWATCNYLSTDKDTRERRSGLFRTQSRAVAWMWRTLATAAAITPDSDPLRAEYANAWGANMIDYHDRYVTGAKPTPRGGPNNLGAFSLYAGGVDGDAYGPGNAIWEDAPWMQHFLQAVLGFAADLEIPLQSAAQRNAHIALRNFAFKHVIGMLGKAGEGRPYQHAGVYQIPYGTTATANELKSPLIHYPSWAAQWEADKKLSKTALTDPTTNTLLGSSGGDPSGMATGYWGNLHPAIALAVDAKAPGAAEAYARLVNASNYTAGTLSFHNTPQFGIVPR